MSVMKGRKGCLDLWELHHGHRTLEAEDMSSPAESPPDEQNKRSLVTPPTPVPANPKASIRTPEGSGSSHNDGVALHNF